MPTNPSTALVWNFVHNWRSPFQVTRSYRTDIFTSRSKREQRRALMSTPRLQFGFESVVQNDEWREYEGLMMFARDKPFVAPDWTRRAKTSASAASGNTTLQFTSLPSWIVAGRALFLYDGRNRPTRVIVATVLGNTVTLTSPLAATWAAGSTVLPAAVGLLNQVQNDNPVNGAAVVRVTFDVEPASEPKVIPPVAPVTFDGREVCTFTPNWANGISQDFIWDNEKIDFGRGTVANFFPFAFPERVRKASFVAANEAEARLFENFFDRMKGQRGEFYMPTGVNDLPPSQNLFAGVSLMRVAGTNTHTHYSNSKVFKAICVKMRDGTRHYRLVTGLTLDAGETVIAVDSPWPAPLAKSDVLMVSWMPLWRFATDSLSTDWLTGTVSQFDMPMKTLEHLAAE